MATPTYLKTPIGTSNNRNANNSRTQETGRMSPFRDRFIPNRLHSDLERSHFLMTSQSAANQNGELENLTRRNLFLEAWAGGSQIQNKVLSLSCKTATVSDKESAYKRELSLKYHTHLSTPRRNSLRTLPKHPELILDVPNLKDDFYLNLFDWSKFNEKIAIGIDNELYIWNANTKSSSLLLNFSEQSQAYVTSVKWMPHTNIVAVAKSNTLIYLWDIEKEACIGQIKEHESRVGSLAWNEFVLTSGSLNGIIMNHDMRCLKSARKISEFKFHEMDICGLAWSNSGQILACGSDDKKVSLWDKSKLSSNSREPLQSLCDHNAAVKALAWCPWNNLLATGGGKQDGTIKLWNSLSGVISKSIETDSQISALLWSSQ